MAFQILSSAARESASFHTLFSEKQSAYPDHNIHNKNVNYRCLSLPSPSHWHGQHIFLALLRLPGFLPALHSCQVTVPKNLFHSVWKPNMHPNLRLRTKNPSCNRFLAVFRFPNTLFLYFFIKHLRNQITDDQLQIGCLCLWKTTPLYQWNICSSNASGRIPLKSMYPS